MNKNILEALRAQLLTRSPLENLPKAVWERVGVLNTWGTNAIEGNTLTLREVETVLLQERSVGNKPLRDLLETKHHQEAFRELLKRRSQPMSLTTVLELHETVFKGIYPDAGRWRRINVYIEGAKHRPPRAEKVVPLMAEWEKEYDRRDLDGESVFLLAAWMHDKFESIHPFADGNGRVGRLLLNLHFLKHDWPPVNIIPPDRERYLSSMRKADEGDLASLIDLLEELMGKSLMDLLDQVGTPDDELKPLRSFARRGSYSANYLTLRAGQGELPAVKVKGDWHTSSRALELYKTFVGRGQQDPF